MNMNGAEEVRAVFSAAHLFYIPICLFLGVILGWILRSRTSNEEITHLSHLLKASEAADHAAARPSEDA